jgi:hypothetical protein
MAAIHGPGGRLEASRGEAVNWVSYGKKSRQFSMTPNRQPGAKAEQNIVFASTFSI